MNALNRAGFSAQQWRVLTVILVSYLVILLDTSIVITGLPEIRQSLGFSVTGLSWVQNIYTLCFGGLLMLGARLGDLLGRKRMYLLGLALFVLASLLIGAAQSPQWLLAARALQGIGAAILAPSTLALLSINFSEGHERTRALAYYAATAGIGATLGLVLGGLFAGWLSWRVGFFINVPIGIALLLTSRSLLVESERHRGAFDLPGAVLSTVGTAALVYGIEHAATAGWQDSQTLIAAASGVALLVLFVLVERRSAQPLLPLRLFNSRERVGAYLGRMLFLGAMVSFFFFTTQFMQNVLGMTPVQAGIGFIPFTVPTFFSSIMVPRLTRRLGNSGVLLLALLLLAIGMYLLSHLTADAKYLSGLAWPMLLLGLGNGAALGPLTISGVAGVEARDAGAASGLVNMAHQLGGTLGLSIMVVVFAAAHQSQLDGKVLLAHQLSAGFAGCLVALLLAALVTLLCNLRPTQNKPTLAAAR